MKLPCRSAIYFGEKFKCRSTFPREFDAQPTYIFFFLIQINYSRVCVRMYSSLIVAYYYCWIKKVKTSLLRLKPFNNRGRLFGWPTYIFSRTCCRRSAHAIGLYFSYCSSAVIEPKLSNKNWKKSGTPSRLLVSSFLIPIF